MVAQYSLYLYTPVVYPTSTFMENLTDLAWDWRRSVRAVGGYWQGSFSIQGDRGELQRAFDTWIGCHVVERTGGITTWEGMIYEMDLTSGGVKRRRSLDLMWNAVKTSYTTIDWVGTLLSNGGFETLGGGGADVFADWTEGSGAGVADETTIKVAGSHACKITSDGNRTLIDGAYMNNSTSVSQDVSVTEGCRYKLSAQAYGDARVGIYNPNAPTGWLVPPTTVSADDSWKAISFEFTGPVGSVARIYLWPGEDNLDVGYFDSVGVEERGEAQAETDWMMITGAGEYGSKAASMPSVGRYGRKEEVLCLDDYPLATAVAQAKAFLAESMWAWARPVSAGEAGETVLEVRCAGYVHTANWQFVTECDGVEGDLDDWIADIAGSAFGLSPQHGGTTAGGGDCQFLRAGNVTANTLQVPRQRTVRQRAWDTILELVSLGIAGAAGEQAYMPTRAWVGAGRLLHYAKVDRTPRYYLKASGLYESAGGRAAVTPWAIQPAVFRDLTYPNKQDLPGSFTVDARDFWVEEVEVDATGRTVFKTALFGEADAIEARARWLGVLPEPSEGGPMPTPPLPPGLIG